MPHAFSRVRHSLLRTTRQELGEGRSLRDMTMVDVTLPDGDVVAVRTPARPPKPKIHSVRRRELAAMWLESVSQHPSPERIEALAPFVGRYRQGSPMHRIASVLVGQNELPTADRVEEIFLVKLAQRRRNERRAAALTQNPQVILAAITTHWDEHGNGPSWRQLADLLGIDVHVLNELLTELRKRQLVDFTSTPGSLRANPGVGTETPTET